MEINFSDCRFLKQEDSTNPFGTCYFVHQIRYYVIGTLLDGFKMQATRANCHS